MKLLLLLALAFSPITFAQWRAPETNMVERYNRSFGSGRLPYWMSVQDTISLIVGARLHKSDYFPGMQIEQIAFSQNFFVLPYGRRSTLTVYKWSSPEARKAPLVIYLPGIFQDQENENSYEAVHHLLKAGNHVLLIPNALSGEYMSNMPTAGPANFEAEADVVEATIEAYVTAHRDEIASVHIAGASYGAFVAAIVMARDSARAKPLIDGQTTLIFPPWDMNASIHRLDHLIDAYFATVIPATPSVLVGFGFYDALTHLLKRMHAKFVADQQNNFIAKSYPAIAQPNLATSDWIDEGTRKKIRFEFIVYDCIAEDTDFYQSDRSKITHWLELARRNGNQRFRILTTDDDWLNEDGQIESLPEWIQTQGHLLIRKSGGHAGMVSTHWFEEFVTSSMRVR